MLKVGIIGASGFIGSRITEVFTLENIAEVQPIVRDTSSLSHLLHLNLKSSLANALDSIALQKALTGCDLAIHCAAGSPWFIKQSAVAAYQAAENAKVRRLVYLSSASVHGQAPKPNTDETSSVSDRQFLAYNNAKVRAERELLRLRAQGTTEVVILRPGIVVGPGSSWVVGFANSLRLGTAYLVNSGKGICNTIYIDNLVHGVHLAMIAPNADRQAFLVGDAETVTWADLYQPIARTLGINLSQLPDIDCSSFKPSLKEQLRERLKNSEILGSILYSLSQRQKNVRQTPQQSPLNQEMAWLYQCEYKLPDQKADAILNYSPIVSFDQACDRTVAWLTSSGYSGIKGELFKEEP